MANLSPNDSILGAYIILAIIVILIAVIVVIFTQDPPPPPPPEDDFAEWMNRHRIDERKDDSR